MQVVRVAGRDPLDLTTAPTISGLSATRYFLTMFLLIPKLLAIPRADTPSSLARWIAFHLALCHRLGFLRNTLTGCCTP